VDVNGKVYQEVIFFIHFPLGSQLEHRASFRVSVISHTIGPLWMSDQTRRDLYLHRTTQHINNRQTSTPPATKQLQTYAFDCAATVIGISGSNGL
jgi:hypothetical protein